MPSVVSLVVLISGWFLGGAISAQPHEDLQAKLIERNRAATEAFQAASQAAIQRVNERFGIDYVALDRVYGPRYRELRTKLSILETLPDERARRQQREAMETSLRTPEGLRYMEARLFLENELERDHLWKAKQLQACEDILDLLIANDPLLHYFFTSPESQHRYGQLLKLIVWDLPEGTAGSTRMLDAYTMFADRMRMPVLIKLSPKAFSSLAYLRSTLIHELDHVLLYKEPLYAPLEQWSSPGDSKMSAAVLPYNLFLKKRYQGTTAYQYHLVHEYYSFVAQLLCDDRTPTGSVYRLSLPDRRYLETLRSWTYDQLADQYKRFVSEHPNPPIVAYLAHSPTVDVTPQAALGGPTAPDHPTP